MKSIANLHTLLVVNALLYGIIFFGSVILYFITYLELFHKHVRNKNMIEHIKYNIINRIFLNTLHNTRV